MSVLQYTMPLLNGQPQDLSEFLGSVVLIVNTASECGFTYQYEGLEELYKNYQNQGLVILGFPCNQFGAQEPGNESQIASFCESNFRVSFPMFAKVEVNGPNAHPLFTELKKQAKGVFGSEAIKWNFTKFLVDQTGIVVDRYAPSTTASSIESDILNLFK